jgi:hypothetical protein
MTASLYFEADSDRCLELSTLSAKLGVTSDDLLNEALQMLLASFRDSQSGAEPIGLMADLHAVQSRIRTMIKELEFIRFTTASPSSMLHEVGVPREAAASVQRHYEKILDSSERALKAAGLGPMFLAVPEEQDDADAQPHLNQIANPRLK